MATRTLNAATAKGVYTVKGLQATDWDKLLGNMYALNAQPYFTVGRDEGSSFQATGTNGISLTGFGLSSDVFDQRVLGGAYYDAAGNSIFLTNSLTQLISPEVWLLKSPSGVPLAVGASLTGTYRANLVTISSIGEDAALFFFAANSGSPIYVSDINGYAVSYDGSSTWTVYDPSQTPLASLVNHNAGDPTGTYDAGGIVVAWAAGTGSGAATGTASSATSYVDHIPIQNAIDAAANAGWVAVHIKGGLYWLGGTITQNNPYLVIEGEGRGTVLVGATDYGDIIVSSSDVLDAVTGKGGGNGHWDTLSGTAFRNLQIYSLVARTLPWNGQALPGGKQMTDPTTTATYVRGGAAIYSSGAHGLVIDRVTVCDNEVWSGTQDISSSTFFNGFVLDLPEGFDLDGVFAAASNIACYVGFTNSGIIHGFSWFTTLTQYQGIGIYLNGSQGVQVCDTNCFSLGKGIFAKNTYALVINGGYAGDSCTTGVEINGGTYAAIINPWGAGNHTALKLAGVNYVNILGGTYQANSVADIEMATGTSNVNMTGVTCASSNAASLLLDSGATSVAIVGGAIAVLTNNMAAGNLTMINVAGQPSILGNMLVRLAGASTTAAGSDQSGAIAFTTAAADIQPVIGTTGQSGYGVKFALASVAGQETIIVNTTAFALKLYPYSAENIGAGASTAITISASHAYRIVFTAAGTGYAYDMGARVTS